MPTAGSWIFSSIDKRQMDKPSHPKSQCDETKVSWFLQPAPYWGTTYLILTRISVKRGITKEELGYLPLAYRGGSGVHTSCETGSELTVEDGVAWSNTSGGWREGRWVGGLWSSDNLIKVNWSWSDELLAMIPRPAQMVWGTLALTKFKYLSVSASL